jgi:hypothetical protein
MNTPPMDEGAAARTRLRSFSPIFPVRDLRRALAHYASLGFEAEHDFPAERRAAAEPVSALDGRSVLVTEWAEPPR